MRSLEQKQIAVFIEYGAIHRYLESGEVLTTHQRNKLQDRLLELEPLFIELSTTKSALVYGDAIDQYSLNGEYIATWTSAEVAALFYYINADEIHLAVNYQIIAYKGFIWRKQGDTTNIGMVKLMRQNPEFKRLSKSMEKDYIKQQKDIRDGEDEK